MLTYKAMYKYLDEGVHGEVLDFPGVTTCGTDLEETRRLLASALVDMAETYLLRGEPLPPKPECGHLFLDVPEKFISPLAREDAPRGLDPCARQAGPRRTSSSVSRLGSD
ncbi:MAG: type II toxin-antitoxin system HicB family antitoxin [Candidatus Bipolaricaulia bacterium]